MKDLPSQSNVLISVKCDFCGDVMTLMYYDYDRRHKKNNVHKDCCKRCSPLKHKEVMLDKYGVESPMHLEECNKKVANAIRLDYDYVKKSVESRNYKLLSKEYNNAHSEIKILCLRHNLEVNTTWNNFQKSDTGGCPSCIKELISADNSHLWKGGVSPLHSHLRKKIQEWKNDSMKQCNFKCVITNESFDVIHHLHGFSEILQETLNNLKLPIYENIEQYAKLELKNIETECLRLHYKYGLGVCLKENLHKEFHSIYGQKEFTSENFKEFVFNKTGKTLEQILEKEV